MPVERKSKSVRLIKLLSTQNAVTEMGGGGWNPITCIESTLEVTITLLNVHAHLLDSILDYA